MDSYPPQQGGSGYRVDRRVQLPSNLSEEERSFVPRFASLLERRGYEPVYGGGAPYALEFSLDEGPINIDATARLYRHGDTLVDVTERDGGPRILMNRSGVRQTAVQRCLEEFDSQLEDAPWGDDRNYPDARGYEW